MKGILLIGYHLDCSDLVLRAELMTLRHHTDIFVIHERVHDKGVAIVSREQLELPRPHREVAVLIQPASYETLVVPVKTDRLLMPPVLPQSERNLCSKPVPSPRSRSPGIRGIFVDTDS